jgi:hypothetical protein
MAYLKLVWPLSKDLGVSRDFIFPLYFWELMEQVREARSFA